MCGICGIKQFKGNLPDNLNNVYRMAKIMKHRGPDDNGFYFDRKNNLGLGFDRLSIIDLSNSGHQPMHNEDKSIWIVFNGEIYNFLDLRKKLSANHKFISQTDTEVIIHLYEEQGEKFLQYLEGMFALAIWDQKKQKLILARDRIGKKPLFYFYDNNNFIFSSEFRSILAIMPKNKIILDERTVELWNGFPYLPDNNNTMVKNIKKIPPGHYLVLKNNKSDIKQYWKLETKPKIASLTFDEAKDRLEKMLTESVRKRLVADVGVGILLSGGLDSSVIAALASINNHNITTLTASFSDQIDESKYAKKVAEHLDTKQLFLHIKPKDVIDEIEKIIWIYDDMSTSDGGLITTHYLSQEVRKKNIKVVLVGEGADELFGGYTWFGLGQTPFGIFPQMLKNYFYYYAIMRSLKPKFYFNYAKILSRHLNEAGRVSYFKKINYNEICYSLPNHYCMKVDRGSASASIEARAPYLDYKVVEFVYNLPDQYKLAGNYFSKHRVNEKYILRQIAKKYLPREISDRKKKGGMLPIDKILDTGINKISDYLLDSQGIATKLYSRSEIEKILINKKFKPAQWEREWILWRLFLLSVWYKKIFNSRDL